MSLNDKLKVAAQDSADKLCKLAALLSGSELTADEKKNLIAILEVDDRDPTRVPSTTIGQILREEGYDISNSAVDRHRKTPKACSCKIVGKK
jgi:hypothetical protein